MQVDPIKPTLKAPGVKRLKLQYDGPVSKFAFKSNFRHYTQGRLILEVVPETREALLNRSV